jgi:KDO2-lipid IV(A) lauroyltransferase
MPLTWMARIGRAGGWLAWKLDRRHRETALRNLTQCFGSEKTPGEIRAIARENLMRIGEAFASGAKTSMLSRARLGPRVKLVNIDRLEGPPEAVIKPNRVVAVGHFGNFELYARIMESVLGFRGVTTYRSLNQPGLDRVLHEVRQRANTCTYYERRKEAEALRREMNNHGVVLGLLCDQNGGDSGVVLPFFGRPCSTSTAPALFALRYNCTLHTAICRRVALAQWEIVVGEEIPTHDPQGEPRTKADIMLDVNQAFEAAIRRDPCNWFWVHNRWKPGVGRPPRKTAAAPE